MQQKTVFQVISETFRDFTEQTSIHGLKYICQKNISLAERILWGLVTLGGAGMAVYMTTIFWERYTSNPTRTSIKTLHAPTVALPFPAVTLCNENVVLASKVRKFMGMIKYDNISEEYLENALLKLQAFTNLKKIPVDEEQMRVLHEILRNNNYNIEAVMNLLGQNCKELLVKCQWNFENVNCMEIFLETYAKSGMCCTFYGTRRMRNKQTYTDNYGTEGTLSIIINPIIEQNKFQPGPKGLKVLFHNSLSYPDFRALKKIITTGTQTHMQILGTRIMCSAEVVELPIEQRDCVFLGEVHLKHFRTYTDANCLIEREATEISRICDCVPYYYDFSEKSKCNILQIPCLTDTMLKNNSWQEASDVCPATCEDSLYEVKTTQVKLERGNFYHIKESENIDILDEHTTHLKIYFVEFQKVLRRDLMFSTVGLMASFGGIYSLFMGCSLLTICEIFYYCTLRLLINKHIFARHADTK